MSMCLTLKLLSISNRLEQKIGAKVDAKQSSEDFAKQKQGPVSQKASTQGRTNEYSSGYDEESGTFEQSQMGTLTKKKKQYLEEKIKDRSGVFNF